MYKDINIKLQMTLYEKRNLTSKLFTDTLGKPKIITKKYNQALCVKRICSTNSEFEAGIIRIVYRFSKRGSVKTFVENQIEAVGKLDRSVLLAEKKKIMKVSCLPLSVTWNSKFPNIKNILQQQWYLQKIEPTSENTIQQPQQTNKSLAFRKKEQLKDITGSNKIEFNKLKGKALIIAAGNCTPCLSNN